MLPAILLTGSLGAGKTTVLNELIAACPDRRIAVIENEAGEIPVDGDLLIGAARVVDVLGGCACCSVRGELHAALELLSERLHEIDTVVVEASGIADPVAIIQAFQASSVRNLFRLTSLVAVLDAHAEQSLPDLARQVRHADTIVLSKLDRIDDAQRNRLTEQLSKLAPLAEIVDRERAQTVLPSHLERSSRAPVNQEADAEDPGHGFKTVTVGSEEDLARDALELWLATLALTEPSILRIKGTVALAGTPGRTLLQRVGGDVQLSEGPKWGSIPRRSRLVIIGQDLDRGRLQAGLQACVAQAKPPRDDAARDAETVSAVSQGATARRRQTPALANIGQADSLVGR